MRRTGRSKLSLGTPKSKNHWQRSCVGWVEERNPTYSEGFSAFEWRPNIGMRYRRAKTKGGTFFFTVVTFRRMRIFTEKSNVDLLRASLKHVIQSHPFKIDAFVLLPDHLHCIWTLPEDNSEFSTRWRLIKTRFTLSCDDQFRQAVFESRKRKKEQAVWQRRFWEHQIRDEHDFQKHVEYIHYNPVHHKYVTFPKSWPYSSFHRYVREGKYESARGMGSKIDFEDRLYGE